MIAIFFKPPVPHLPYIASRFRQFTLSIALDESTVSYAVTKTMLCVVTSGGGLCGHYRPTDIDTHLLKRLSINQFGHHGTNPQIAFLNHLPQIGQYGCGQHCRGGDDIQQPVDGSARPVLRLQAHGKSAPQRLLLMASRSARLTKH
jgi:hypothetical protein